MDNPVFAEAANRRNLPASNGESAPSRSDNSNTPVDTAKTTIAYIV
jgi:hypothetical protein